MAPRAEESRPFLVGVAGGSGSGKTALARAIEALLGPDRASRIAQDDYYRDHAELSSEARAALNFDVPAAVEHALFLSDLRALRRGVAVRPPRYCFESHRRRGVGAVVEPREIVIVEGILLFADPRVWDLLDLRCFVDAPAALRLRRRLARDTGERGRTAASVITQFQATVEPAHATWVEPAKACADLVLLNTSRVEHLAEIAVAVIESRLQRRSGQVPARRGAA